MWYNAVNQALRVTGKRNMDMLYAIRQRRQEILRIAGQYGASEVRIFGSAAKGRSGIGSDVDVLVKLEPGRSLLDIIALKQDLEDLLGRKVDLVTEASISPYIREQVLREAVSL